MPDNTMKTLLLLGVVVTAIQFGAFSQEQKVPRDQKGTADEAWEPIKGMVYSPDTSQTLVGGCRQFIKSFPDDKRSEEAQHKIDETV
jgi:hypothetical protein